MKKSILCWSLLASLLAAPGFAPGQEPGRVPVAPGIPAANTVTLVDLGAKSCLTCKTMAPFLEELKREYQGRAEVIFIDVNKQPEMAKPFGLKAIPTQIVYDRQGKEVFRHLGFMEKKAMREQLERYLAGR